MTFALQITIFGLLVMEYDRVGDGDKISYEKFSFGMPHFHPTVI